MPKPKTRPYFVKKDNEHAIAIFELLTDESITSESLADLVVEKFDHPDSNMDYWWAQLTMFWAIMFWLVKDIPLSSSEQDRLADAMVILQAKPPPPNMPLEITDDDASDGYREFYRPWIELPCLSTVLKDYAQLAPLRPPLEERARCDQHPRVFADEPWARGGPPHGRAILASEWANMHALAARIHGRITKAMSYSLNGCAIVELVEGLEGDLDKTGKDELVPPAAVWIIYADERLIDKPGICTNIPSHLDRWKRYSLSKGELWKGVNGIHRDRWRFWSKRFETISTEVDLKEETRQIAKQAHEKMVELGDCQLVR